MLLTRDMLRTHKAQGSKRTHNSVLQSDEATECVSMVSLARSVLARKDFVYSWEDGPWAIATDWIHVVPTYESRESKTATSCDRFFGQSFVSLTVQFGNRSLVLLTCSFASGDG